MELNKIQKFIKDNGLDFDGYGSNLNSTYCSLSGYALHLDLNLEELKEKLKPEQMSEVDELDRVFEFAESHNYGAWWTSDDAKEQYKF